jgi:chromosome segregation ATPase
MARGGINKVIVQKAREALLARGENPSIDAVRVELGNTGSKTTIHRYMKELEAFDPRPQVSRDRLSDELSQLVAGLLSRLMEEGTEAIEQARIDFDEQRTQLASALENKQAELVSLQRQYEIQQVTIEGQIAELQTTHTSLQTEITRNARLSQNCADLEVRVHEKDEQIRSLEEKHLHARDALEHYRNAIKEQREQEQRRHEGQLQQVQVELRQLQQIQIIKQDELTRLNRDNERLLSEARQSAKAVTSRDDVIERLNGELNGMKTAVAKADGAKEMLQEQVIVLRAEAKRLNSAVVQADAQASDKSRQLHALREELEALKVVADAPTESFGPIDAGRKP